MASGWAMGFKFLSSSYTSGTPENTKKQEQRKNQNQNGKTRFWYGAAAESQSGKESRRSLRPRCMYHTALPHNKQDKTAPRTKFQAYFFDNEWGKCERQEMRPWNYLEISTRPFESRHFRCVPLLRGLFSRKSARKFTPWGVIYE